MVGLFSFLFLSFFPVLLLLVVFRNHSTYNELENIAYIIIRTKMQGFMHHGEMDNLDLLTTGLHVFVYVYNLLILFRLLNSITCRTCGDTIQG